MDAILDFNLNGPDAHLPTSRLVLGDPLIAYQERAAAKLVANVTAPRGEEPGGCMLIAPTGSGKTRIMATAIVDMLMAGTKPILLIQPNADLIEQNVKEIHAALTEAKAMLAERGYVYGPGRLTCLAAQDARIPMDEAGSVLPHGLDGDVVFATQRKMLDVKDAPEMRGFRVALFDEGHRAAGEEIRASLKALPNAYKVGITATPVHHSTGDVAAIFGSSLTDDSIHIQYETVERSGRIVPAEVDLHRSAFDAHFRAALEDSIRQSGAEDAAFRAEAILERTYRDFREALARRFDESRASEMSMGRYFMEPLADEDERTRAERLLIARAASAAAAKSWWEAAGSRGLRTIVHAENSGHAEMLAAAMSGVRGPEGRSPVVAMVLEDRLVLHEGGATREFAGAKARKERSRLFARARRGEVDAIVNCSVLKEGVDIPAMDCTMLARRGTGFGALIQRIGRTARAWTDSDTGRSKDKHVVLDLGMSMENLVKFEDRIVHGEINLKNTQLRNAPPGWLSDFARSAGMHADGVKEACAALAAADAEREAALRAAEEAALPGAAPRREPSAGGAERAQPSGAEPPRTARIEVPDGFAVDVGRFVAEEEDLGGLRKSLAELTARQPKEIRDYAPPSFRADPGVELHGYSYETKDRRGFVNIVSAIMPAARAAGMMRDTRLAAAVAGSGAWIVATAELVAGHGKPPEVVQVRADAAVDRDTARLVAALRHGNRYGDEARAGEETAESRKEIVRRRLDRAPSTAQVQLIDKLKKDSRFTKDGLHPSLACDNDAGVSISALNAWPQLRNAAIKEAVYVGVVPEAAGKAPRQAVIHDPDGRMTPEAVDLTAAWLAAAAGRRPANRPALGGVTIHAPQPVAEALVRRLEFLGLSTPEKRGAFRLTVSRAAPGTFPPTEGREEYLRHWRSGELVVLGADGAARREALRALESGPTVKAEPERPRRAAGRGG